MSPTQAEIEALGKMRLLERRAVIIGITSAEIADAISQKLAWLDGEHWLCRIDGVSYRAIDITPPVLNHKTWRVTLIPYDPQ